MTTSDGMTTRMQLLQLTVQTKPHLGMYINFYLHKLIYLLCIIIYSSYPQTLNTFRCSILIDNNNRKILILYL